MLRWPVYLMQVLLRLLRNGLCMLGRAPDYVSDSDLTRDRLGLFLFTRLRFLDSGRARSRNRMRPS